MGDFDHNVIGSTTSILHPGITTNGSCNSASNDTGNIEPRSSFGIRTDPTTGRQFVVVLSTVSWNGSPFTGASAFDFCQIFRALGVESAIVLDGNSAAAIWYNGVHLNPLRYPATSRLNVGGPARRIISSLVVAGR